MAMVANRGGSTNDEPEVTKEDQQMINLFSATNSQYLEAKVESKNLAKSLQEFEDSKQAIEEFELTAEPAEDGGEATLGVSIGECFMYLAPSDATSYVDSKVAEGRKRLDTLQALMEKHEKTLLELKVKLTSKFKDKINLEDDKEDDESV